MTVGTPKRNLSTIGQKKIINIFFEKVEKMNNFRQFFKQKFGSRFRMTGVNTHNKFQAVGPLEQKL